jgi:hypothetical protein
MLLDYFQLSKKFLPPPGMFVKCASLARLIFLEKNKIMGVPVLFHLLTS